MSKNLTKCNELIDRLQELKKALQDVTQVASNRKPAPGLPAGWSVDMGSGDYHHSTHGVISPGKQPDGTFRPVHGGRPLGYFGHISGAGKAIGKYINTLKGSDTGMMNPNTVQKEESLDKSNYGPPKGGQFTTADNVKRKQNNVGDVAGEGPNVNVKAFSTKPGQLSAKQQAAIEARKAKKLSGKPRTLTPEEVEAYKKQKAEEMAAAEALKFRKSLEGTPWAQHNSIPSADEEVERIQQVNPVKTAEDAMATQLANMMTGRNMLGIEPPKPLQGDDFVKAGEAMGMGTTKEQLVKSDQEWGGAINNWLVEAQKPISSRFATPEEEQAYWDSIKVANRDDGKAGY